MKTTTDTTTTRGSCELCTPWRGSPRLSQSERETLDLLWEERNTSDRLLMLHHYEDLVWIIDDYRDYSHRMHDKYDGVDVEDRMRRFDRDLFPMLAVKELTHHQKMAYKYGLTLDVYAAAYNDENGIPTLNYFLNASDAEMIADLTMGQTYSGTAEWSGSGVEITLDDYAVE